MSGVLIRKVVDYVEEVRIEGLRPAPVPLRMAACAAVIRNPWYGPDFVQDLHPEILAHAKALADALVPRLVKQMGGADRIEAFGKAAIAGASGEVEHAAGLIHTLYFGNAYRSGAKGDAYIPFTNTRAGMGTTITIPLRHKDESMTGSRAHFLTMEFAISDAPAHDEIIVALAAASGGRPHHRIGDRFIDMKIMGVDQAGRTLEEE